MPQRPNNAAALEVKKTTAQKTSFAKGWSGAGVGWSASLLHLTRVTEPINLILQVEIPAAGVPSRVPAVDEPPAPAAPRGGLRDGPLFVLQFLAACLANLARALFLGRVLAVAVFQLLDHRLLLQPHCVFAVG